MAAKKNGWYRAPNKIKFYVDNHCYGYIKEINVDSVQLWFYYATDAVGKSYSNSVDLDSWRSYGAASSKKNAQQALYTDVKRILSACLNLADTAFKVVEEFEEDDMPNPANKLADAMQERAENSIGL